ncbi:phage tail tape measure protein [Streptomyces sp. NPDC051561]|uniref:phage tail tape measure protein n=1 Tax=Streptomyces sp. NPDC051561 TaxID=3365658 RepID=UPI00378C93F1
MALTVGELLATITVDDAPAQAGMGRAEAGMRATGNAMVGDADRAGQQAGRALGDGMADGSDRAASGGASALKAFGWAALGAGIGAALMAGIGQALEQGKIQGTLQAQLGSTGPVAAKHGKAAGDLYAGAIVDSVQTGADVIKGIAQNGLLPPEATSAQITTMGRRVADTAGVMGEDVGKVSRAVGVMLKSGIAKSADEAMNVLVKGTQKGVNSAEDLLDTFAEYPTQFRDLGLDAQTAMGLMQQGLQGGARDADTVADGLKEFAIRSKDMSKGSVEAFQAIGLNAGTMAKVFTDGGPKAAGALDTVLDRLRKVEDPAKRNAIAVGLFGTKAEDLQSALFKMDPSSAVNALGSVKGAVDGAGNAMRDNAATKIEVFKRAAIQGVVELLGTYVIPALMKGAEWVASLGSAFATAGAFISQHSTAFSIVAGIITAIFLPTLIVLAVQAGITAAAVVTSWVTQTAAGATAAVRFLATNALLLAGWIAQGTGALAAAGRVVAAWVLMGVQSMIQGARMAAAWVLAMGPVGWIIAAIVALVALVVGNWDTIVSATKTAWDWVWNKIKGVGKFLLDLFLNFTLVGIIIKHWDSIKAGTQRAWDAVVNWVKGIPGKIVDFFLNWTLVGLIIKHWDSIKTGVARKAVELVAYVKGLPERLGRAVGNLGRLLYDKGVDTVKGMWNGIKSMGAWLGRQLVSFAKNMIPGPIAKALGIHSPSRVMARSVGRWIPAGIVAGIRSGQGDLDRTMTNLVKPTPAPAFAGTVAGAPTFGMAPGNNRAAVHIEHWHGGEQTPSENAAALEWRMKARG